MKIIPAIDIMNGRVVRLFRGDAKTSTDYGDPIVFAGKWKEQGASSIHIIDLTAAFSEGNNFDTIVDISHNVGLPVQVGGGIRTYDTAKALLELGVSRVILGTLAFQEPKTLTRLREDFEHKRLIIALDHKNGHVMVDGWKTGTKLGIEQALQHFIHVGIETFLVTSISADGTLGGADLNTLKKIRAYDSLKIIAAGGIGSLKDLADLKQIGIDEAVVGKALYEGVFTLKDAIGIAGGD
jgi:phosphoribosylformimino-5-aminoimidazole carboxamide ribotide isomerase